MPRQMMLPTLALGALLLAPAAALAAMPTVFNAQGLLSSVGGGPVADGSYTLTFILLDGADPATAQTLHSEIHVAVPVEGGRFSVQLGQVANQKPMPASAFAVDTLFLAVQVGVDPPLPPVAIMPTPLALRAATADTAKVALTADVATQAQTALAANALQCTGCVGIDQVAEAVLAADQHKALYNGQVTTVQNAVSDLHGRVGAFEGTATVDGDKLGLGGVAAPACKVELGESCQQGLSAMMVMKAPDEATMLQVQGEGAMVYRTDVGAFFGHSPDGWKQLRYMPFCGDGIVEAAEQCDDGLANALAPDACRPNCTNPICGDGVADSGEQCDDGNGANTDACVQGCLNASCGDGFVQAGVEECDDSNGDNTDTCVAGCKAATCGDGFVQAGVEECDDGANNSDVAPNACRTSCKAAACGDGVLDAGEQCDDGNTQDGDGCPATCVNEVKLTAVCGKNTQVFCGGDCSNNHNAFANWYCQLAGYSGATKFDVISSGSVTCTYYKGGNSATLSQCSQVLGPTGYGTSGSCTAVKNLHCQ